MFCPSANFAWKSGHVAQVVTMSSTSTFMLIQWRDSHASSLVFFITLSYMCSCFSTFPWCDTGIIIFVPFKAILSIITISSLNNQYSYRSFCTLAFTDGQAQNTYSDSMLRCSLSIVADLISSTVMQFGMSMHDWHLWLGSFLVFLYLTVESGQHSNILCSHCNMLTTFF